MHGMQADSYCEAAAMAKAEASLILDNSRYPPLPPPVAVAPRWGVGVGLGPPPSSLEITVGLAQIDAVLGPLREACIAAQVGSVCTDKHMVHSIQGVPSLHKWLTRPCNMHMPASLHKWLTRNILERLQLHYTSGMQRRQGLLSVLL